MTGPLPLRAHNLLCLLGFRGRGYDERFVREMAAVHARLAADPTTTIEVRTRPDRLCEACPHLASTGCTLGAPDHEPHMRAQDEDVARRLGLTDGGIYAWSDVLDRIGRGVRSGDLPSICTTCPWLSLGWCAEGIDQVGRAVRPPGGR